SAFTAGDGVSTYLALIFGTLLSSQGTDASFVITRTSRAFLRALPFVLRFKLYQGFPAPLTTVPQACGMRSEDGI
ncbi:hypothetical protein ABT383_22485, partial [Streptomyces humidus]